MDTRSNCTVPIPVHCYSPTSRHHLGFSTPLVRDQHGTEAGGRWLQPHDPRLTRLSRGCKAPRAHIPAAKAGDSHLPQGRDQHEGGLLSLPSFPSIESSISSERRMPYCPSANSMDMDATRLQDSWPAQMSGVITLMAIFLPVAAWAPKYSHVGVSGTV